jgi:macrodomain Ter protein organizer (MatP/YcbG family)
MAEKLKTVGLDAGVWRQLKLLALENEWTLSEAVQHLLNEMDRERQDEKQRSAEPDGKSPGGGNH